jgi:hypothetical protein
MNGGNKSQRIEIDLTDHHEHIITLYIDVGDTSLGHKWLCALEHLISGEYHLEKNYCFLGFPDGARDGNYILDQVNHSIQAINTADLGYRIQDRFDMATMFEHQPRPRTMRQERMNDLHRYFEELQGVSGSMSVYYQRADAATRWHIRQLNLLCHEFESWALSWRKQLEAPDWIRPSQLMCWLGAPRFKLEPQDFELFGVDTISRRLGGVYVGVNKAVGKHHWEVFHDEGRDSRIGELTTTVLKGQTEAAGDFDIEWGRYAGDQPWQLAELEAFRDWLRDNGFDPEDKSLTIGHPCVAQVDLQRSFGSEHYRDIWQQLNTHLNVAEIRTPNARTTYQYRWSDTGYAQKQIDVISKEMS